MPCPLFLPDADLSHGRCSQMPEAPIEAETIVRCCSRGYARAVCDRAAQLENDATSFAVRSINADTIEVAWALERNHHPVEVGVCRVSRSGLVEENTIARQARAWVAPIA